MRGLRPITESMKRHNEKMYRVHLEVKKRADEKKKTYSIKPGVEIETIESNQIETKPSGSWYSFENVGKLYEIRLFVKHERFGDHWAIETEVIENDRNAANEAYKKIREIAESLPENYIEKY